MQTRSTAQWNRILAPYTAPDVARSVGQLATTAALFAAAVTAAHLAHGLHWSLGLPFSFVAGLVIVKLFIIQHDCGHRSFLPSRNACDWVGRALSVLTWTPYGYWKADHDRHHATSGDLDRRGAGDIDTLTVAEYTALGRFAKLRYRAYRHPATLFGIAPSWQFLLRYRIPAWLGPTRRGRMAASILLHDAALVGFFGGLCALLGWTAVAAVWIPAVVVAATLGIWMFYVQHQFDTTYWEKHEEWSFVDAALHGCSYYELPRWMHWLTGNIGYHHIHHLSSRIPNYNLPRAFAEVEELRRVESVSIRRSLSSTGLALWCERRRKLVTFGEAYAS